MVRKNSKRGKISNSRESDIYKNLRNFETDEIKGLFVDYLKKNLDKISSEFLDSLKKEKISIPSSIFNHKLTVLESIVKYLKENQNLSYAEISGLIGRDQRNLWHTYYSSSKKSKPIFVIKESEFLIPLSIFSNRKLSILENLVFYLKQEFNLSYHKIAVVIRRNDRTVWTVYQKAKRKNGEK